MQARVRHRAREYESAFELFERAQLIHPAYECEGGLSAFRAGHLRRAEELLRLRSDVRSASCLYNLGLVLEAFGRRSEARRAWEDARALRSSDVLIEALERVQDVPSTEDPLYERFERAARTFVRTRSGAASRRGDLSTIHVTQWLPAGTRANIRFLRIETGDCVSDRGVQLVVAAHKNGVTSIALVSEDDPCGSEPYGSWVERFITLDEGGGLAALAEVIAEQNFDDSEAQTQRQHARLVHVEFDGARWIGTTIQTEDWLRVDQTYEDETRCRYDVGWCRDWTVVDDHLELRTAIVRGGSVEALHSGECHPTREVFVETLEPIRVNARSLDRTGSHQDPRTAADRLSDPAGERARARRMGVDQLVWIEVPD